MRVRSKLSHARPALARLAAVVEAVACSGGSPANGEQAGPGVSNDTLMRECTAALQSTDPGSLQLTDTIVTTAGPPPTRSFYLDEIGAGPGGCIFSAILYLGNCMISFGPMRDASGALILNVPAPGAPTSTLDQVWCPSEGLGTRVSGTLAFQGVSCPQAPADGGVVKAPYCYAGVFELRLTSEPTDAGAGGALTGMPFHLAGAACPISGGTAAKCGG